MLLKTTDKVLQCFGYPLIKSDLLLQALKYGISEVRSLCFLSHSRVQGTHISAP